MERLSPRTGDLYGEGGAESGGLGLAMVVEGEEVRMCLERPELRGSVGEMFTLKLSTTNVHWE